MRFQANDIISVVGAAPRYDLAESAGPDLHLADLLDESGVASLLDLPLGYGTAQGDPALRAAIAELHGAHPDDVVVTVGSMHALFLLTLILCERDDEAITTSTLFPLTRNLLQAVGSRVHELPATFDGRYQPDLAALGEHLSPRTKLVSVASPQNPSGVAIAPGTLREIIRCMEERCPDAWLVVDETYREGNYGSDSPLASALGFGSRVISLSSLSKAHGAPGIRVGWAIVRDKQLREQVVLGRFNSVISVSSLDEAVATKVLQQRDWILSERRQFLGERLQDVSEWVLENAGFVEWVRPDAGALCCVRLRSSIFNETRVQRFHEALAATGVRVAAGPWFGDELHVFRLGFGRLSRPDLQTALKCVSLALEHAAGADCSIPISASAVTNG